MITWGRLIKIHWQNCQISFLSPNFFMTSFGNLSGSPQALTASKFPDYSLPHRGVLFERETV